MTQDRTGQRIDNYQLLQKLGGGSFGQVYLIALHQKQHIHIQRAPAYPAFQWSRQRGIIENAANGLVINFGL